MAHMGIIAQMEVPLSY